MMKETIRPFTLGALGAATWLFFGATLLYAQDRPPQGTFDPQQMRQRMLDRMRQQLEVQDDAEWKLISERIAKVMEARRAVGSPGGPGARGNPGGPPPPQNGSPGSDRFGPPPGDAGPSPGGPAASSRESNPELEALRKAIDAKASSAEVKAALAKFREARKTKEAELEKAQDDLRQLLSVRQEAIAVTLGLLK